MSAVVFFDPMCPTPYSARTLRESALGGTEATVTRIAEELDAIVVQHNRTDCDGRYRPPEVLPDVEHVIVLRESRALRTVRKLYLRARYYLWVHDRIGPGSKRGRRLVANARLLSDLEVTIICVSDFQRRNVEAALRNVANRERIRTRTIYNPVDDALRPNGAPVDPSKLIFFSSPNKGLAYTLNAFQALRRRMPDLRLQVANPGYKRCCPVDIDGVEWLGPLPHERILMEVRTALCTFCPNFVIPETFGLVLAESKAVGTLTHACGAAEEVLADPRQTLPVTLAHRAYEASVRMLPVRHRRYPARIADELGIFDCYAERIEEWRSGRRPKTGPDTRFLRSTIVGQWRALLGM